MKKRFLLQKPRLTLWKIFLKKYEFDKARLEAMFLKRHTLRKHVHVSHDTHAHTHLATHAHTHLAQHAHTHHAKYATHNKHAHVSHTHHAFMYQCLHLLWLERSLS